MANLNCHSCQHKHKKNKSCYIPWNPYNNCMPPAFDPCTSNPQTALAAYAAIASQDSIVLSNLLAPGGSLHFHGDLARTTNTRGTNVPVIPFAGIYGVPGYPTIAEFITNFFRYGTNITFSAPGGTALNSNCTVVVFQALINYTPVALTNTIPPTIRVTGTPEPLLMVFVMTFNSIGKIQSIDIFTDTSALAIFYNTNNV